MINGEIVQELSDSSSFFIFLKQSDVFINFYINKVDKFPNFYYHIKMPKKKIYFIQENGYEKSDYIKHTQIISFEKFLKIIKWQFNKETQLKIEKLMYKNI